MRLIHVQRAPVFLVLLVTGINAVLPTYAAEAPGLVAQRCNDFLNSLGVNTHVSQGYDPVRYVEPLIYLGVHNIRDSGARVDGLLALTALTGVKVDIIANDVERLVASAKKLAKADALLAVEGPNEPNNFPVTYGDRRGGGSTSWLPVADLQRDLFAAIHGDSELQKYPVFHVSEGGAETDNVGMQFLSVPEGARILLPDGTKFADYANAHNYVSGTHAGYVDNQAWSAADPVLNSRWDGLYGEYGKTWNKHFDGYSEAALNSLPRVTTETGWEAATPDEERIQGIVLVNNYLAQFSRGWKYTFIYELAEGEGGGGHQGLFHADWTPKLAATYIHNLTTILSDNGLDGPPAKFEYSISSKPVTVHDLLLQKKDGTFQLIIWGEQVSGENRISVDFGSYVGQVNVFDTTMGTAPVQTLIDVMKLPLTITDHALIVEIH